MIIIQLDDADSSWAKRVGQARNRSGLINKRGYSGDGERVHIMGAAGELAFCRASGILWPAHVNTFGKVADVPPDIEIKTRLRPEYDLLLAEKDDYRPGVNAVCVHVTTATNQQDGEMRFKFFIVGWWDNTRERKDEWIKAHGGREAAHFIPADELCTDFSRWGIKENLSSSYSPPPDLHALIKRFGVYTKIPPDAWLDWDRLNEDWKMTSRGA